MPAYVDDGDAVSSAEDTLCSVFSSSSSRSCGSDDGSSSSSSDDAGESAAPSATSDVVMAVYADGCRVGCALYTRSQCRIEAYELRVALAGSAWLASLAASCTSSTPSQEQRVGVGAAVPSCLLWLVRLIHVHRALVLLPDDAARGSAGGGRAAASGAAATSVRASSHSDDDDKVDEDGKSVFVGAVMTATSAVCAQAVYAVVHGAVTTCTAAVLYLSHRSAFCAAAALPRLRAAFPQASDDGLRARVCVEHAAMCAALAALLHYTAALHCNLVDVVECGPRGVLYVSAATLRSLQVVRRDCHPCDYLAIAHRTRGAKEGISLRGVLEATSSALGRALLRQWCALPCCDVDELQRRYDVVDCFVQPSRQHLLLRLRALLHRVQPTGPLFTRMRSGCATRRHYQQLHRTLRALCALCATVAPLTRTVTTTTAASSAFSSSSSPSSSSSSSCPALLHALLRSCAVDELDAMAQLLERSVVGVGEARVRDADDVDANDLAAHGARSDSDKEGDTDDDDDATAAHEVLTATTVADAQATASRVTLRARVDATGVLGELRAHMRDMHRALRRHAAAATAALPSWLQGVLRVRCVHAMPYGYLLSVLHDDVVRASRCARRSDADGDAANDDTEGNDEVKATRSACAAAAAFVVVDEKADVADADDAAAATITRTSHVRDDDDDDAGVAVVLRVLAQHCGWELHHVTTSAASAATAAAAQDTTVCADQQHTLSSSSGGSGHVVYTFKSNSMRALDAHVGDVQQRMRLREEALRRELDAVLLHQSLYLLAPTTAVAELDCLLTFAWCAARRRWTRPRLRRVPGELRIEHGCHPVLACVTPREQLQPFSFAVSRASRERVSVVVGAHGSGKSVLLGAIGTLVVLAQLGSFVPAAAMSFSPLGSLWTTTTATTTATSSTSSLSNDATVTASSSFHRECVALQRALCCCSANEVQARHAVLAAGAAVCDVSLDDEEDRHDDDDQRMHSDVVVGGRAARSCAAVTARLYDTLRQCTSLVLLDEFGRGTAPDDGCALLHATLQHFCGSDDGTTTTVTTTTTQSANDEAAVVTLSAGQRALLAATRPIVVCATHFVDGLFDKDDNDDDDNNNSHNDGDGGVVAAASATRSSLLSRVRVFDLPCQPVYDTAATRERLPRRRCHHDDDDNNDTDDNADCARDMVAGLTDIVPLHTLHCITARAGFHGVDYARYRVQLQRRMRHVTTALAQRCGLHETLLQFWHEERDKHAAMTTTTTNMQKKNASSNSSALAKARACVTVDATKTCQTADT